MAVSSISGEWTKLIISLDEVDDEGIVPKLRFEQSPHAFFITLQFFFKPVLWNPKLFNRFFVQMKEPVIIVWDICHTFTLSACFCFVALIWCYLRAQETIWMSSWINIWSVITTFWSYLIHSQLILFGINSAIQNIIFIDYWLLFRVWNIIIFITRCC